MAIHSASHKYNQIYTSEQAFFDDLEQMNSIIKAQTGNDASIIRFPGGSSNTVSKDYCPGIMTQLVNDVTARGLLYCDWNVSSGDANSKPISTEQVVQNVISGVQIMQITVYVNSEPDFTKQPKIADFASEYFCEELGESGVGSRAAVGVAVLPGEAPVEIAIIAGVGK